MLLAFSACDLETPQRVQVRSTLDPHIPVGDIGQLQEVKDALEYLKIEKIRESFEKTDDAKKANVYYYYAEKGYEAIGGTGYVIPLPDTADKNKNAEVPYNALNAIRSDEARTLFIHFPLSRMDLDFSTYMKTEIETPDVVLPKMETLFPPPAQTPSPGEDILGEGLGFDVKPIPLGMMNEWVTSIDLNGDTGPTTVTLKGGAGLKDALKLAIPGLGIGNNQKDFQAETANESDFAEGTIEGDDLVFEAAYETTLKPQDEKEVNVYPRLVKVPLEEGGKYNISVDLMWTEAEVDPGKHGDYNGQITLPLSQLAGILAKYKLVTLPCYLYVGGPFDEGAIQDANITLGDGKGWNIEEAIDTSYEFPVLYPGLSLDHSYGGPLSYVGTASFNLAAQVNENYLDDMHIVYKMQLGLCTVQYEDVAQGDGVITADLVVLAPAQLEVRETEPVLIWDGHEYIRMMEMADYGSEGDLFGRDKAGVSKSQIANVRISGTNVHNTIFAEDLFLRIYDGASFNQLHKTDLDKDFSIDIAGDAIPMPFQPKFAIYVEKPEGENAVVKIEPKRDGVDDKFSIKLSADVTGEVEYEQDL